MTQQVLIDPLQDSEVLQTTSSGLHKQGSGTSHQLIDLDATKNRSNILKRTNFRQEERDVLVSLISEYKGVLDRKSSKDTGRWRYSHLTPTEAWQLIADKFNSHSGFRQRDPGQLRKCWMNMKARSQFSMAQRRQLGLECSNVRPSSRSFAKARQTVAIRLRNTGTPNTLTSRSNFASRKSTLSRVNGSSQAKIKKSRQRVQEGERYRQDVVQQRGYDVAKTARGFSNYQMQPGESDSELQYLQETVHDSRDASINRQRQPRPVQLLRSTTVMSQASEIQKLPEMRTTQGYLLLDASARSTDQRSGNIQHNISAPRNQGQHQMMTVAPSLAQNSNRSRQIAVQPPTILTQMEQFSPTMPQQLMSNTVTVGEFLGKTVEMRTDAARTTYSTRDDASNLDVSVQHLRAEDDSHVASDTVAERLLPQESIANESVTVYNTVSQVRPIESMADLESALDAGGPVISNVTSISEESRAQTGDSSTNKDLEEVEIIIKTEDEGHDRNYSVEKVIRTERAQSSGMRTEGGLDKQTPQKDGKRSKSSANNPAEKSRGFPKDFAKDLKNTGTQTETITTRNSDVAQQPSSRKQRESSDHTRSKNQRIETVVRADGRTTLRDQNRDGKLDEDLQYLDDDDDDVMNAEDNDVHFIAMETERDQPGELHDINNDVSSHHDQTGDPSQSFAVDEHPNERCGGYDYAEEEKKARVDLLYYEVEKAKEEAGAAKCRRELLEVELEIAKQQMELTRKKQEVEIELMREQQMELTRKKQEVEIELMREKVRQEKAKADSMMVHKKETHKPELI